MPPPLTRGRLVRNPTEVGVKKLVLGVLVALFGSSLWAVGCGSSDTEPIMAGPGSGGASGASGSAGAGGATAGAAGNGSGGTNPACTLMLIGETCSQDGECCSNHCDPAAKICAVVVGQCKAAGASCSSPLECCTSVCDGGQCGPD